MVKKEAVKVLVRTRPTANFSQDQIIVDTNRNSIQINRRDGSEESSMDNKKDSWNFQFDKVLHNAGQDSMYNESTEHIVNDVLDGKNGTVMAYGQTGAGKTFTMIGDTNNFKQRGLIPRAISHLFTEIDERPQQEFQVKVSFMEIYNEKIFDLLDENGAGGDKDFQITECARTRSMQVRGLTMEPVGSEEEALNVLFRGEQNRIVAEHQLNNKSNRSHSIFTLHLEQKSRIRSDEVLRSKLNLVDLAGSERLKKAIGDKIDDKLKRESRYINKSLTYLEQVVVALTGKSRSHIPYRQTKLTNVLKDSLGGNCNTTLIACIWGEAKHIEESISTLKLAQRMMRVENLAESNVQNDPALLIKRYERQIRELKQELMMHDALANRSGISYEEYTPEECKEIAKQVRLYVDAPPDEEEAHMIQVENMRHIHECFRQFKQLVCNVESEVEAKLRKQFLFQSKPANQDNLRESLSRSGTGISSDGQNSVAEGMVGEREDNQGFGLGQAAPNSRPKDIEKPAGVIVNHESKIQDGDDDDENNNHNDDYAEPLSPMSSHHFDGTEEDGERNLEDGEYDHPHQNDYMDIPVQREDAFRYFTQGPGSTMNQPLTQLKKEVQQLIPQLQSLRNEIKSVQAEIEDSQAQIDSIRAESKTNETKNQDGEMIIDEEEYLLLRRIKDLKKDFRALRENYDETKSKKDSKVAQRDQIQSKLLERFQEWFKEVRRYREEKEGHRDILDDSEKFDKMELERVQTQDPESVAFFKAQKAQKERARRRQRPVQQQKRV